MAQGTCALFGPERMSIVTLYVVASSGTIVTVPDMWLDVAPVAPSVAMYCRRGALDAPAGVGEAVVAVEALDDPDAHAAARARAKSGNERIRESPRENATPDGTRRRTPTQSSRMSDGAATRRAR